jgi:hypothetical protein
MVPGRSCPEAEALNATREYVCGSLAHRVNRRRFAMALSPDGKRRLARCSSGRTSITWSTGPRRAVTTSSADPWRTSRLLRRLSARSISFSEGTIATSIAVGDWLGTRIPITGTRCARSIIRTGMAYTVSAGGSSRRSKDRAMNWSAVVNGWSG